MTVSAFRVRAFERADFPGIAAARASAIREVCARDYNPAQIAAWADNWDDPVKQLPRFGNSKTWVAEVGGDIVGFTNLVGDGYVDTLYVHAPIRGAAWRRSCCARWRPKRGSKVLAAYTPRSVSRRGPSLSAGVSPS